jgi:uncharacterized protein (DUF1501 family)
LKNLEISMNPEVSRRKFLKMMAAGTCGAVAHGMISPFQDILAYAAPDAFPSRILVLVNFAGGCSYNIAPPYGAAYRDKNPTISYGPQNSLALSSEQGLHPSLTGLKSLYDEGSLAVLNLVGYPNANRSHDESMDVWFRGLRNGSAGTGSGWFARASEQSSSTFAGVSLGGSNLLIQGGANPPRAFGDLNNFGERGFWCGGSCTEWLKISRDNVMGAADAPAHASHALVKGAIDRLNVSLETIRRETNITLPVTFPTTGFGQSCRDAAKLIAARSLGVRLIYLQLGGFDTHAGERQSLTQLMNTFNGGITALVQTLKSLGRWGDVSIITMSEFSRTHENGSNGTDHGHSGPMFVLGGNVNGGVLTPAPSGAEYAQRAYFLDYHLDFRQVFRQAVAQMGFNADAIFPESISSRALSLYRS